MREYIEPTESPLSYEELQTFFVQGEKCNIRAITIQDAPSIYENANDPSIYKKRLTRQKDGEYTEQDAYYFVDYVNDEHKKNHKRVFGIEVDGKVVWVVSITKNDSPYDKTVYMGAWIGTKYRGKWYPVEALRLLQNNAKKLFPGLIRLEARLFETNTALPHILEQLWFVLEAKLENRIVYNGNIMDEVIRRKSI